MRTKEFRIYVNDKLEMTCFNEFIAMNNILNLKEIYGEDNVRGERIMELEEKELKKE